MKGWLRWMAAASAALIILALVAIVVTERAPGTDPAPADGPKVTVAHGSARGYRYRLVAYRGRGGDLCLVLHARKFLRVLGALDSGACTTPLGSPQHQINLGTSSSGDIAFLDGVVVPEASTVRAILSGGNSLILRPVANEQFPVKFLIAALPKGAHVEDVAAVEVRDVAGQLLTHADCNTRSGCIEARPGADQTPGR